MAKINPPGNYTWRTLTDKDISPIEGNRETGYRFDILDNQNRVVGELEGVEGGSLSWNSTSAVRGSGSITVRDLGQMKNMTVTTYENRFAAYSDRFLENMLETWAGNTIFGEADEPANVSIVSAAPDGGDLRRMMRIQWGTPSTSGKRQVVTRNVIMPTVTGTYTLVFRVWNTDGVTLRPAIIFNQSGETVGSNSGDWHTLRMVFPTPGESAWPAIENLTPASGQTTYVEAIRIYYGVAAGFSGEEEIQVPVDWHKIRVRPVCLIKGQPEVMLGTFIPNAPIEDFDGVGRSWKVDLLDRATLIQQYCVPRVYTAKRSAAILPLVRQLIKEAGEDPAGISDRNDITLRNPLTWPTGTSALEIINDLLAAAGYLGLATNGKGAWVLEPKTSPRKRPIVHDFVDDENGIYVREFSISKDTFKVPNMYIAIGQASGDAAPPYWVARNFNPQSPYSFPSRGRWVTEVSSSVPIPEGANAGKILREYGEEMLLRLSSAGATIEIQHAPVPGLQVNSAVTFRSIDAGIQGRFIVRSTDIDFDPASLSKTVLVDVAQVALDDLDDINA